MAAAELPFITAVFDPLPALWESLPRRQQRGAVEGEDAQHGGVAVLAEERLADEEGARRKHAVRLHAHACWAASR